ncbi:N-acetylmuramoyl-L-alanine amidase [Clostridium estertheticum]|uniref:N-acetylmuramoyl-L-alanine amidase n=1 Tax=Clostridium estertheticum TaxID=238834 RepID=A0AA47EM01_9CLOT|nr:N-acetylmuramoyl-L-alanine amidase [Clostridium estertheticum]MBU3155820.1 N-acetylmuramoyl-L-alanine amidase [Clostridium estertheticum]MBU3199217.1 N-acetylmuramoyl-L-alanine amidase [Clostridium estertheticum]WAG62366.1 N-acetylmuramoyl-L-alanine amidase [Clostridium estertheticum]WAG63527.1 N-acetylmuramoyl-L-alanine amidase [Clostridium estertheticum]
MKKIFKVFIIMILAFVVSIPMQTMVQASTFTSMSSKKDVAANKPWSVSFNKALSLPTVNTTNIKVVDEDNNYIEITVVLTNNNKTVVAQPVKNYECGKTYTLIVTDQVKSSDGKVLPSEVRMDFTTKSLPTKPSEFTVCIDPAQYYSTITSKSGVKAKDINLSTALKLGTILKARGFNVVYTRNSDEVSWTQSGEDDAKALIAKNANADVFLSINTNSYTPDSAANGIETYYTTDKSANKSLASSVQAELITATKAKDRGIQVGGSTGDFSILNKTSCPVIVAELGFITNPSEEILLESQQYQNNATKAIANGLMSYAGFANTDTDYDNTSTVSSAADILVNVHAGDKYTLPATTNVTMSNNTKKTLGVTWPNNVFNIIDAGTYDYYGTINGTSIKVKAIITVGAAITTTTPIIITTPTTELQSTVIGEKLFIYLTPSANVVSTLKAAVKLHDGVTINNCVYFSSEAMRRISVPVPIGVCNTHQYLNYLNSNKWSKTKDIKELTPGSLCFTTNDGTGYPTHTFVFMGWVNDGDYTIAYIADNQGQAVHTRSMLATGDTDAFAFFMSK